MLSPDATSFWISRSIIAATGVLIGVFSFAGCGGGAGTPKTEQATVSGSVVNDGKPITAESNVVFYCKDADATASGKLDVLGKFSLKAANPAVGIPVGRYQVMISPPTPPAVQTGSAQYQEMMMGKAKLPEPPKDIPQEFMTFVGSGLVLEVKGGANTFDLDLAKLKKN